MTKKEIISKAESLGFKLDYDQSEVIGKHWMRFVSEDKSLDEQDLRWIWWMGAKDKVNIQEGEYIASRLKKKKEIQDFLKY